jgi:hypothetical protein
MWQMHASVIFRFAYASLYYKFLKNNSLFGAAPDPAACRENFSRFPPRDDGYVVHCCF